MAAFSAAILFFVTDVEISNKYSPWRNAYATVKRLELVLEDVRMSWMFDLHCLGEFSRSHCLAICAFLVPANLIATSQTILFTILKRRSLEISIISATAIIYASLMVMHVVSWFIVGVVMAPTFILTLLGLTCLVINLLAVWLVVNRIDIDFMGMIRTFVSKFMTVPSFLNNLQTIQKV